MDQMPNGFDPCWESVRATIKGQVGEKVWDLVWLTAWDVVQDDSITMGLKVGVHGL